MTARILCQLKWTVCFLCFFLLTLGIGEAATYVWSGGGADSKWSTGANWTGGIAPTNNGTATIVFAGTNQPTPDVDAPWSVSSITFSNTAGSFVIGGSTLTIGSGGVVNDSPGIQTINNAIALGAAQSWNAASNNLAFTGAVNNVSNLLTINGAFNCGIAGNISGTGGLTKTGTGTNVLSGSNSYSGLTSVTAGALNLQSSAALGSGPVTVSSGAALQVQGGISLSTGMLTLAGSGLSGNGALQSISGSNRWNSPIALTATATIGTAADSLTLSGGINNSNINLTFTNNGIIVLSGSLGSGTGSLTKNGNGVLVLSAANSYTGATSINGGTVQFASGGSLPNLSTTATTNSTVAGSPYPISISQGTLGAANYTFTFANGLLTVTPASSSITLNASTNPAPQSNAVVFTATLGAVAPGSGTPTGSVLFLTNGVSIGAAITLTNGAASFSISNLPHATNIVSAQYAGDGNFNASSNFISEIINSAPLAGYAYYSRPTNVALHIKISSLLTNATDPDGDPITLFGVSAHSTNNATITTNGTFLTYLPPGTNGNVTDTFTYTVGDSFGATNSGIIVITLLGSSTAQSANITGISSTNGTVLVGFAGIPGYSYYIQASTNLLPTPAWLTISTNEAGPNGLFQFLDTQASNYPVRYYRTVSP